MTWRQRMFTPTGAPRPFTVLALAVVTLGLSIGIMITYVVHEQRKICGLIVLLDDRNQKLPPATDPDTTRFRDELHRYRTTLGC